MTYYTVNATMTLAAWVTLQAEDEDAALAEAVEMSPSMFEYDFGTAEVEFNVTPSVERAE